MSTEPQKFPPYEYLNYKKPTWWIRNYGIVVTIAVGLMAINAIFISNAFRGGDINPDSADKLGSFVGGYIGSMFGLVSVVFLVLTLRDQRESSNMEKFENKYFEMIRLHRDNVMEIGIGPHMGKKSFVFFIREFRTALPIVRQAASAMAIELTSEKIFIIAYLVIFYGIGKNSTRILKKALKEYGDPFVDKLVSLLNIQRGEERKAKDQAEKDGSSKASKLAYISFDGHQSRLGHYYRHLYQTITYVDGKNDIVIDKYNYVKTVRAQLSNHEQALLFINSLSPIGKPWWGKELMVRYKLVKNLPESFFDEATEINLSSYFPADYFEYERFPASDL